MLLLHASALYHSWLQHLLSTCLLLQEEKMSSTFKLELDFFQSASLSLLLSLNKRSYKGNVLRELSSPSLFSPLTFCLYLFSFSMPWLFTQVFITPELLEAKELKHHPVSECKRHKGTSLHHSITPLHPICLLHAQYSPLNWHWWGICF